MTAGELLTALRTCGAELSADGGRLRYRAPEGAISDRLRERATAQRGELLALLEGPPPGARLFFQEANAAVCWPDSPQLFMWTWEKSSDWLLASETPAPPCEPVLAVPPRGRRRRCPGCSGTDLRVAWVEIKNGKKQLQVRCRDCGALQGCLQQRPDNPELIWLATGEGGAA